jgi:hypothetical protein
LMGASRPPITVALLRLIQEVFDGYSDSI